MAAREHHPAFSRNFGFYSDEEQRLLAAATVAIAGVGGDGFQLAYKLAMNGVGTLKVADPEAFAVENANRVFAATKQHIGKSKAKVFKQMVSQLPLPPKVVVFEEGVTPENIDTFLENVDLLIDESELTYLHIGTLLARKAREKGIPQLLVMNVGFAGVATSFQPAGGKTFEEIMGIPHGATLKEIAAMKVDFGRVLPYLPPYGDETTLREVQSGAPLPSISQGVDVASAIGSTEAFLHLTAAAHNHRRQPTWAPKFRYMDAYTNKSGVIRMPRYSYTVKGLKMIARSRMGLNPMAAYAKNERTKRTKRHTE
jgi:hypothetical protein